MLTDKEIAEITERNSGPLSPHWTFESRKRDMDALLADNAEKDKVIEAKDEIIMKLERTIMRSKDTSDRR